MPDIPFPGPDPAAVSRDPELVRWADAIRAAASDQRPLWLQGGASKEFLHPAPGQDAAVLDTRGHSGIVDYEPTELVITARCGTPLETVEATLAESGQYLAFEPPKYSSGATVGGAVAAGLSGPARASAGAVRDFVLGAHLLNGRGELLEFGGQVMKNVAGYDVSRLLAGSMGTLGVLTQVSLKVLPVAPAEATLCFALPQAQALERLSRWRGLPLPLNASCWVRDDSGQTPRDTLYLRLRGAVAAVEAASQRLLAELDGERLDQTQAAPDWVACRDQTLPFFRSAPAVGAALWRLSVAPTTPPLAAPWPTLIEWHGGLRWVWAPLGEGATLRAWTQQAGGHATLFRLPAGVVEAQERFTPPAPALLAIQQRLKSAFDPAGVFNPGRWGFGI